MSVNFEHTLERQDGGNPVALRVTDDSVTLTIPPPVTPNEKDAIKGLEELAKALKKDLGTENIPQQDASAITIKTNERDPALGIIVAQILEANHIIQKGEARKFEDGLNLVEHPPAQQEQARAAAPAAPAVAESLATIREALAGKITSSDLPERISGGDALPAQTRERESRQFS